MTKQGTEQKAEMTPEKLADKVIPFYGSALDEFREGERKEFLSDLRSVIRGELIRYENWMHGRLEYVDEFLNNNQ